MKYLKVWTDFRYVIQNLQPEEKGYLFDAMMEYAETGEEPENLTGDAFVMWPAAKRDIDHAIEESQKRSINGSKGGRGNKAQEKQDKANESNDKQIEANESRKEKKRNEMKRNEMKGNENIVLMKPRKQFVPPSVEDVAAYCEERGTYWIDPQRFVDYYETRGWMLTKDRKMVDWKAAVRLWEKNERDRQEKQKYSDDLPY